MMNYPSISEYVEAIKVAEGNFNTLKNFRPVLDEDGEPVMISGNFAVVFKMKDEQTGKLHAVKCFLKEQEGRAEAYRMIAEELEYVNSTFLTPIKYLDKELFVDSKNSDETEFPVLLMDWVEGQTLDKYIRDHIDNQYELSLLAYQFNRLAMWLMPQPFAHGDLKPDNILVKDDGTLVLVDYDGMYVPVMKGQKAREFGSPDFRHPLRNENDFDEHIDDFPLSSILLSLLAIANEPSLLEKYGGDGKLLLSERDYRNIAESEVLDALRPLMADKNLTTYLSLFYLCSAQKSLFKESYHLFTLQEPEKPYFMVEVENLSTEVTEEDLANAWIDEHGVKYSKDKKRLLSVPRHLKTYSIRKGTIVVCDYAFNEPGCANNSIEKVIIPNTVTHIGNYAFGTCCSLQDILLPDSIKYIGDNAFTHCYNINFEIPPKVIHIGNGTFWNCRSLSYVSLPQNLKRIGNYTFANCYSISSVQIPNSIIEIGDSAFADCFALEKVVVADSVKRIGDRAFFECYGLKDIQMSKTINHLGNYVFKDCRSLEFISLPETLFYLGKGAFECCEALLQVEIKGTIQEIAEKTFCGCHSLSQVTIPNSVKTISDYAFETCGLSQIELPNSINEIRDFAFSGNPIKHINIPESVSKIGGSAFSCCTELVEVHFHSKNLNISSDAFDFCPFLKSVIIPVDTKEIFKQLLPQYQSLLIEQECGWTVKNTRLFNPEEIAAIKRAEVVSSKYGNSVCFFMQAGGQTYIPLSKSSSLSVGDTFDLTTVKVITLCREGKDDIYRIIE